LWPRSHLKCENLPNCNNIIVAPTTSDGLPERDGPRPKTFSGPLHLQCSGHGDSKYLDQIVDTVLTWRYIEAPAHRNGRPDTVPIRIKDMAATTDPSAFITRREFARVLLASPTIYLALPLVSAHWAIVRGWAEPHYLRSFGLMPAGTVVLYTPRDRGELEVCYGLFSDAYQFACKFADGQSPCDITFREFENTAEVYEEIAQ
jgi:hypothetical protein